MNTRFVTVAFSDADALRWMLRRALTDKQSDVPQEDLESGRNMLARLGSAITAAESGGVVEERQWHLTGKRYLSLADRCRLLLGVPLFVRFRSPDSCCHAACELSVMVQREWPAPPLSASGWPPLPDRLPPAPPPPPFNSRRSDL